MVTNYNLKICELKCTQDPIKECYCLNQFFFFSPFDIFFQFYLVQRIGYSFNDSLARLAAKLASLVSCSLGYGYYPVVNIKCNLFQPTTNGSIAQW